MKDFESMTVIRVEYTVRLTLPALNVWKWLTIRNVEKWSESNQLHYFNKVIEIDIE